MRVSEAKERSLSEIKTAHKSIKLRKQNKEAAKAIVDSLKLSEVTARVLAARGFKDNEELKHFINPTLKEGLPDPKNLKNLDLACDLIAEIAEKGGRIAICCDFDVDGLSGGAQVFHFLKSVGIDTEIHVPDRFEDGYGLNEKMIRKIAENKCSLVITVDYGTTNLKELTTIWVIKDLSPVKKYH